MTLLTAQNVLSRLQYNMFSLWGCSWSLHQSSLLWFVCFVFLREVDTVPHLSFLTVQIIFLTIYFIFESHCCCPHSNNALRIPFVHSNTPHCCNLVLFLIWCKLLREGRHGPHLSFLQVQLIYYRLTICFILTVAVPTRTMHYASLLCTPIVPTAVIWFYFAFSCWLLSHFIEFLLWV